MATVADLLTHGHPALRDAFASVRAVGDLPTQEATRRVLIRTLEDVGIPATRALVVALNAKLLRPNSGPDSDDLIATLVRHWSEEEQRIGCAIDVRVMAVAARQIPEIATMVTAVLQRIGGTTNVDETQVFNLLQSLLWLTCHDSCPDCIETWQPYQETVRPSRAVLFSLLTPRATPIVYGEIGWRDKAAHLLGTEYHARIRCGQDQLAACKKDLLDVSVTPIEADYQLFYPTVERIGRMDRQWTIDLVVGEMLQP